MVPLQYINKLFCTISAFCCGQILHSQIPKEATFPLEISELIGLKICDNYTLSYFVTNDSVDGRKTYDHGIITQEKDNTGIKFKKTVNHYFDASGANMPLNSDIYEDIFMEVDSVYTSIKKKKLNYTANITVTKYKEVNSSHNQSTKQKNKETNKISIQSDNGTIKKQWRDQRGNMIKTSFIHKKIGYSFEINESISSGSKDSIFNRYDDKMQLIEKEFYKMINSRYVLTKKDKYIYNNNNRIIRIIKGDVYSDLEIEYISNDKIVVKSPIITGKSYSGIRIEYILSDTGSLKNFKQFQFSIISEGFTDSDNTEVEKTLISKPLLKSTGIILCN